MDTVALDDLLPLISWIRRLCRVSPKDCRLFPLMEISEKILGDYNRVLAALPELREGDCFAPDPLQLSWVHMAKRIKTLKIFSVFERIC